MRTGAAARCRAVSGAARVDSLWAPALRRCFGAALAARVAASLEGPAATGAETEMANAVIFSVLGERSLADMCSGGDFDGDEVGISMSRWLTVAGGGHRDHV